MFKCLCPTKQKEFTGNVHGFDIETYNKNKSLLMMSLYCSDKTDRYFFERDSFFKCLKRGAIFKNSIIASTNLGFDYFGVFHKRKEARNFRTMFRGSQLIYSLSYIQDGEFKFFECEKNRKHYQVKFIDTMNFAQLGVKKLGELINISKLDVKEIIGKYPENADEWYSMFVYNMRDAEISCKALQFFIESFQELGATFKNTIASTAMSLFRNRYLKSVYFRHDVKDLIDVFDGYYGGRCECLKRGTVKDKNYYDINSLYPYVMLDREYPDPNSHRVTYLNDISHIMQYEGVSKVDIFVPASLKIPILPLRMPDKKIIFPVGTLHGSWTHVELRKAIEYGCVVMKVHKTHYYTKMCSPFKDYVHDLYNKRVILKSQENPMEYVVKILMNSLYGKFGQKFIDVDSLVPMDTITYDEIDKLDIMETIGDYARVRMKFTEPMCYCIPIWACYVTAYGRLKLYDYIEKYDPVYCDTDSLEHKCQVMRLIAVIEKDPTLQRLPCDYINESQGYTVFHGMLFKGQKLVETPSLTSDEINQLVERYAMMSYDKNNIRE